ncbi:hypothetical protein [Pedobacter sp. MC2016-24]|uniref:hypothetical protein n=1 Tax=Pedobacter sp. MC2016-24 TaxID=2780090 RepID=UPI001880F4F0|nr:hypothetical protein [Pedobacter sp. MC2016-24]MBE9600244.1 hypothetical protein [Pedobacter sp. MC2016-24]
MKQNGILIGLSLLLCIIGFFVRDFFLSFSMTYIMGEKISFEKSWQLPYQTFPCLLFIICFGLIPFLYLLVKKTCELNSLYRKLSSIIFIITSGLILLVSRVMYLKFKASQINNMLQRAEFADGAEIPRIRFEEVNLEIFLIIGLAIGTLITILIFRKAKY